MERVVEAEILDQLDESCGEALHNRRDLRWINALMGNFRWIRSQLGKSVQRSSRILEFASGDGGLGLYLSRKPDFDPSQVHLTGLDLWSRPAEWPLNWDWVVSDLLEFDQRDGYDILIANLIFHQFEVSQLSRIGRFLNESSLQVLIINEPVRRRIHRLQARLAFLLGMNHVTRHDALVSIDAGFRGDELPALLGLSPEIWDIEVPRETFFGAYRMTARRKSGAHPDAQ